MMEATAEEKNRRGSVDEAKEMRRREKKRIQNGDSQKLSREKQASYTRALEHIVNSIDNWDHQSSESPMVKTMMQLRDENSQLRDLVLRMRKRFLSLSTMAATDAGEEASIHVPKSAILILLLG
jgi:flagellar hook-basal body complex protein FliE